MASYGLLVKFPKIKGSTQLPAPYTETVPALTVTYVASSERTATGGGANKATVSVTQDDIQITVVDGPWTAEFLDAVYTPRALGDVEVMQVAQAIDAQTQGAGTTLQKLTLVNAVMTGCENSWKSGESGSTTVDIAITCEKILYEFGLKKADFILRNVTKHP
jgi:hypothetical protein